MPKIKLHQASTDMFDAIEHESLSHTAATQIERMILEGILKSGMSLPGERDLALRFEISRPKVREALNELEENGLIQIVAGDGAFVTQLSAPAMSPGLISLYTRHPNAIYDHLEYRSVQEGFAARLASERGTKIDRERIQTLVEQMKTAHEDNDHQLGSDLDSQFHMAITNASHNHTLIHMMTSLYAMSRSSVFFARNEILEIEEVSGSLLLQHELIAEGVLSGDADKAEQASIDHIAYVRRSTIDAMAKREREISARKRYPKSD
ncbi:MAG: FadR/GntR family transcriptional regulator [Roseobacter sp.]